MKNTKTKKHNKIKYKQIYMFIIYLIHSIQYILICTTLYVYIYCIYIILILIFISCNNIYYRFIDLNMYMTKYVKRTICYKYDLTQECKFGLTSES